MPFAVIELLDVLLRILALAGNQRRDMRAVAVVVVRVTGLAVGGEIEESIGAPAGEIVALLQAGIDHRDADLVAVVLRVREAERTD